MKLISMTDFVSIFYNDLKSEHKVNWSFDQICNKIFNYTNFLKQPLNLGMFVPCDEDGNVLEEPIVSEHLLDRFSQQPVKDENTPEAYRYRKAKEKVLFEGFKLVRFIEKENPCYVVSNGENEVTFHIGLYNFSKGVRFANTVEDLIPIQPILTKSVIKQIEL